MEIGPYLAMTAAEFAAAAPLPPKIAWLGCRFSPSGTGVTGLPPALPSGSLLVLTDQFPMEGHDSSRIAAQLAQAVDALDCAGLLLDFQRPGIADAGTLAAHLVSALPCPVAVSECYAQGLDCPVFLSPCPHHTHMKDHIAPWKDRELWLDLAVDAETILLTREGCDILSLPLGEIPEGGYGDKPLHCHYRTQTGADFARFTLWRTREDLEEMAEEARVLGIKTLVGLWCEWQDQN